MIQPIITLIILVISLHIQMFVMVACRSWHASRCRTHYVLYWSLVCIVLRSHHCWKTKLCEIIIEPFFPLKLSPEAFSIVCFSPEAVFCFSPHQSPLFSTHNTTQMVTNNNPYPQITKASHPGWFFKSNLYENTMHIGEQPKTLCQHSQSVRASA